MLRIVTLTLAPASRYQTEYESDVEGTDGDLTETRTTTPSLANISSDIDDDDDDESVDLLSDLEIAVENIVGRNANSDTQ
jgi:hypothetical protein